MANRSGANPWDNQANFAADATWALAQPRWRSGADLTVGAARSLRGHPRVHRPVLEA